MEKTKINVYIDGVFDLCHYGHMEMIQRVKEKFPDSKIIIGICSDEDCRRYKKKTILNVEERARGIIQCKNVDSVIINCPWIISQKFIDEHEIDMICHDGDPYPSDDYEDVYEYVKSINKFSHIERTKNISTTDIINRILNLYK
jgi:choline-phosphate cytidylyltransferase